MNLKIHPAHPFPNIPILHPFAYTKAMTSLNQIGFSPNPQTESSNPTTTTTATTATTTTNKINTRTQTAPEFPPLLPTSSTLVQSTHPANHSPKPSGVIIPHIMMTSPRFQSNYQHSPLQSIHPPPITAAQSLQSMIPPGFHRPQTLGDGPVTAQNSHHRPFSGTIPASFADLSILPSTLLTTHMTAVPQIEDDDTKNNILAPQPLAPTPPSEHSTIMDTRLPSAQSSLTISGQPSGTLSPQLSSALGHSPISLHNSLTLNTKAPGPFMMSSYSPFTLTHDLHTPHQQPQQHEQQHEQQQQQQHEQQQPHGDQQQNQPPQQPQTSSLFQQLLNQHQPFGFNARFLPVSPFSITPGGAINDQFINPTSTQQDSYHNASSQYDSFSSTAYQDHQQEFPPSHGLQQQYHQSLRASPTTMDSLAQKPKLARLPRAAAPPGPIQKIKPKKSSCAKAKEAKAILHNDLDLDDIDLDGFSFGTLAQNGSQPQSAKSSRSKSEKLLSNQPREPKVPKPKKVKPGKEKKPKKSKRREKTKSTKSLPHIPLIDVNTALQQLIQSKRQLHGGQSKGGKVYLPIEDLFSPRTFFAEYLANHGRSPYTSHPLTKRDVPAQEQIGSGTPSSSSQGAGATDDIETKPSEEELDQLVEPEPEVKQHLTIPFGKFSLTPQPDSFMSSIPLAASIAPLSEEETVYLYREPTYLAYVRLRNCNPRIQYFGSFSYENPNGFAPGQVQQTQKSIHKGKFLLSLIKTRWESYTDPQSLWLRQRVARCVTELPEIILFWPGMTQPPAESDNTDMNDSESTTTTTTTATTTTTTTAVSTPHPLVPFQPQCANRYMSHLDLNTDTDFNLLQYKWCKVHWREIELNNVTFLHQHYPAPADISRYLPPLAGGVGSTRSATAAAALQQSDHTLVEDCTIALTKSKTPGYYKKSLFYYALTIFNREFDEINEYYTNDWVTRINIPEKMMDFSADEIRSIYPDPVAAPPPVTDGENGPNGDNEDTTPGDHDDDDDGNDGDGMGDEDDEDTTNTTAS